MKRSLHAVLAILALTSWATILLALTANYSQPFDTSHGFAWTTTSGACDTSLTTADDAVNGNPANSVGATCVGRNDAPIGRWGKSLSWETMGVTAGNTVTAVDGDYDHAIIQRSHSSSPVHGPLVINESTDTSSCMASDPEAGGTYTAGTGGTAWATQDATGAVNVNSGACQTSSTTVVVRVGQSPATGNNAAATTQTNVDNLVLAITHLPPSGVRRKPAWITKVLIPRIGDPKVLWTKPKEEL